MKIVLQPMGFSLRVGEGALGLGGYSTHWISYISLDLAGQFNSIKIGMQIQGLLIASKI